MAGVAVPSRRKGKRPHATTPRSRARFCSRIGSAPRCGAPGSSTAAHSAPDAARCGPALGPSRAVWAVRRRTPCRPLLPLNVRTEERRPRPSAHVAHKRSQRWSFWDSMNGRFQGPSGGQRPAAAENRVEVKVRTAFWSSRVTFPREGSPCAIPAALPVLPRGGRRSWGCSPRSPASRSFHAEWQRLPSRSLSRPSSALGPSTDRWASAPAPGRALPLGRSTVSVGRSKPPTPNSHRTVRRGGRRRHWRSSWRASWVRQSIAAYVERMCVW
jgi:hypothetical protein